MSSTELALSLREAMVVMLELAAPPLLGTLAIGLLISLVQAMTQVNESTLVFVPKLLVLAGVLLLLGHGMVTTLSDFTTLLFGRLVAIGGAG
ncbi:MAG: flagellar biosynthetic protein FliQ [Rhodospirillales bacterium]|nr:flagellar biosynthetic protein FliQ [Rhodospirillales bacterium]